jgi:hypothetical protein
MLKNWQHKCICAFFEPKIAPAPLFFSLPKRRRVPVGGWQALKFPSER